MKVTISEFQSIGRTQDGDPLPLGQSNRGVCQVATAAGAFAAIATTTRIVRVATDTAIQMDMEGGATPATGELFMPGVEFIAVKGGEVFTFAAA